MIKKSYIASTLAAGFALTALPFAAANADDDRMPTAEERAKIESTLQNEGFTAWEEVEFDDGVWEVDDAVGADGVQYDLWLDPESFSVMGKRPDVED